MLKEFRRHIIFVSLLFATPSNLLGSDATKELLAAYFSGELMTELAESSRDWETDLPSSLISWDMALEPQFLSNPLEESREISFMEYLALNIKEEIGGELEKAQDKALFMILASYLTIYSDGEVVKSEVLPLIVKTECTHLIGAFESLCRKLVKYGQMDISDEMLRARVLKRHKKFRKDAIEELDALRQESQPYCDRVDTGKRKRHAGNSPQPRKKRRISADRN